MRAFLRGVDHEVSPQLLGGGPAAGREVGGHDRAVAPRLERCDHRQAHRPAAHHHADGVAVKARHRHGVLADGEGLSEGRLVCRQAVGHLQDHGFSQQHSLREPAGQAVRVPKGLHAGLGQGHGNRNHPGSGPDRLLGSRPVVQHLGAELMPEDGVGRGIKPGGKAPARAGRRFHHVFHVVEGVQVGSADAAGEGADQDLSRTGREISDFIADQLLVAANDGAHGPLPWARIVSGIMAPAGWEGQSRLGLPGAA